MIKILFIILFFCTQINALIIVKTDDYHLTDIKTSHLITNFYYKPDFSLFEEKQKTSNPALSRIEILYGKHENIDANILIAKETEKIDCLINYNWFKIDSYSRAKRKIFNSSYSYDNLKSSLNLLKSKNYTINLDFDYQYGYGGLHSNTNYNSQVKRNLTFSPEYKYMFSEKSFFNFKFLYSDLKLEYENIKKNLDNQYSFFQTKIGYKRVWSSINSFHFEFFNILDSMKLDKTHNNNYSYINIKDKFAFSKNFTVNLGTQFNINKKYSFVISPSANLFFIFKHFNIELGYKHQYDYLYSYNKFNEFRFYKMNNFEPFLNNHYYTTFFIYLSKNITYMIKTAYNDVKNFQEMHQDFDNILYLSQLKKTEYANLIHELSLNLSQYWLLILRHDFIPYQKSKKISNLIKNQIHINMEYTHNIIKTGFILKYYDLNYFIDYKNNFNIIRSNLFIDIYLKTYFTETFGLMFKIKNLSERKIIKTPGYPEIENIYNLGIIAEF